MSSVMVFLHRLCPRMCSPLSLEQLSILCLIGDLDHSAIAVLPRCLRRSLLCTLPIVDICNLEDTDVVEGIDTESVWEEVRC